MCSPAATALLLAALAALPCRGTDANSSTILNENRKESSQPLINKVYQMLHTSSDQHNETKQTFNSPVLHNFETNTKFPIEKSRPMCCQNNTNRFTSKDGAIVNDVLDKKKTNRTENVTLVYDQLIGTSLASSVVMERKRKSGEAGSIAPLLNYIFDTYSNTHHHRNDKTGNGNSIYVAAAPEIEALVGSNAHMDCKVDALHDKLVSWVRRKSDEVAMELLTTGTQQYTADNRYSARFIPPDIWRLEIKEIRPTDAAFYDCQLSAHPPRTARVTLRVPEPFRKDASDTSHFAAIDTVGPPLSPHHTSRTQVSVRIIDGSGASVSEQVCELGSTVALRCEVRGLRMEGGPSLLWYRREALLNDDTTRGGISVRTEFGANGANSMLRVARVRGNDAGRYTCSIARTPPPSPAPAHVILHIIKGESLAELHQGVGRQAVSLYLVITLATQLLLNSYYGLIQ